MKTSDNLKSNRKYKKIQDIQANLFLFLIIYKIQQHIFPKTSNKFKQLHAICTVLNLERVSPPLYSGSQSHSGQFMCFFNIDPFADFKWETVVMGGVTVW